MPASSRRRSRKSPIFIRLLGLLDIVFASLESLIYWARIVDPGISWPIRCRNSHTNCQSAATAQILSFAVDRRISTAARQAEGHHVITDVGRMCRSPHGDCDVLLGGHW